MARIPYPSATDLSFEPRLNVERMIQHLPAEAALKMRELASAVVLGGELDPQLRELAILRVGHISDCAYELHHHVRFARATGLSEEKIAASGGDPGAPVFSAEESAVLAFVEQMARNVRADDQRLADVQRFLSSGQIMELVTVSGLYMMTCRILENFGVDIEDAEVDLAVFQ